MTTNMTVIFSVLLTASIMTSLFLFYLLKKSKKEKEEIAIKQQEASNNTNVEVDRKKSDPFYDAFSMDFANTRKRKNRASEEGWIDRGAPYLLLDCPMDSIYTTHNKWVNDNASHNTMHIAQVTDRENATVVGICNMTLDTPKGTRFVIEDVYGKVTTEPNKFKVDISANELQGKLVIFTGYIENGKITVKKVSITKLKVS